MYPYIFYLIPGKQLMNPVCNEFLTHHERIPVRRMIYTDLHVFHIDCLKTDVGEKARTYYLLPPEDYGFNTECFLSHGNRIFWFSLSYWADRFFFLCNS